jgi:hypothetical protein
MTPLLLIAGVPLPVFNRNRRYKPPLARWSLSVIPSTHKNRADLHSCWAEVLTAADRYGEDGTHIIACHYWEDDYSHFEDTVRDRHRLIWLERLAGREFGSPDFTRLIQGLADFELDWRQTLRPTGTNSELILPEPSFSPIVARDMWGRARRVTTTRDDMNRIASQIRYFRQTHRQRRVWHDARDLHFDPYGARHARTSQSNRWKFTYLVPEGFHYDVRHARRNISFTLQDARGAVRRFTRYTNVDCHGFVRGGV